LRTRAPARECPRPGAGHRNVEGSRAREKRDCLTGPTERRGGRSVYATRVRRGSCACEPLIWGRSGRTHRSATARLPDRRRHSLRRTGGPRRRPNRCGPPFSKPSNDWCHRWVSADARAFRGCDRAGDRPRGDWFHERQPAGSRDDLRGDVPRPRTFWTTNRSPARPPPNRWLAWGGGGARVG
jgi:hypothetical protein